MSEVSDKQYWKSPAQRQGDKGFRLAMLDEFPEELDVVLPSAKPSIDRRSFLKMAGFAFAGAALGGCSRSPDQKAIPFLAQPEEVIPGRANWYASTCGGCSAACGLLTRNVDGRPIKLEGNPQHPLSRGGLCAVGQASILGLYDSQRFRAPVASDRETSWQDIDQQIIAQLRKLKESKGAVRFLSGTITSPTLQQAITDFLSDFPDSRHVMYDAISCSAILDAHQRTHGARVLPHYRFDRAQVIVSIDADFLGTWISPVEFTGDYTTGRDLSGTPPRMSLHVQVESRMSLTGSKADRRIVLAPWELDRFVGELAGAIGRRAGDTVPGLPGASDAQLATAVEQLADELWKYKGRSLVVCGSNRLATQLLVNLTNHLLGNYGQTLDLAAPSYQRRGDDKALAQLREELAAGLVSALLIFGANPAYDLPASDDFAAAMKKVPLVVSFAERLDETVSLAHFACPDHHYLESWCDHEPVAGIVSLTQPAISPLGNTRSVLESLAVWRGKPASAYEIIQRHWEKEIFTRQTAAKSFQAFWDQTLQAGFAQVGAAAKSPISFDTTALRDVTTPAARSSDKLELVLYPTIGMLDGRHAHNAWLHELPDPVTKVTWGNYASFSPATAQKLGLADGDVVRLDCGGQSIEIPAHVQPGQHDQVVVVSLGYGRKGTDRFSAIGPKWLEGRPTVEPGGTIGRNAAILLAQNDGYLTYAGAEVTITRTGKQQDLACTQQHHSIDVPANLASPEQRRRPIIQETTLTAYASDPAAGSEGEEKHLSLWAPDHKYPGHKWGMAIDISACTGCSACVLSCQIENNVPIVGKDEVHRQREMHWLRVDRYYTTDGYDTEVAHQPMMCQQCDNAACETVCPVLATVHSSEGINSQVYNRCVGTRYCANNCAYKARRFNWFNYAHDDRMQNMVLNPNVTVRSRGVMEKCSFCVQRISEAKARAKERGTPLADGDIQPACQQSCPANAIVFGDLNDPNSAVSKLKSSGRHFRVLPELNVQPSVGYLRIVRNRPSTTEKAHHV